MHPPVVTSLIRCCRAKWKYKICTIVFAVLMAYVIFCAIECAIQASYQGGPAYRIMLFSIIMTYGGMCTYGALSVQMRADGMSVA